MTVPRRSRKRSIDVALTALADERRRLVLQYLEDANDRVAS